MVTSSFFYILILAKMDYNTIVEAVSEDLNLPSIVVEKTYRAYWKFIRSSIQVLPLKEDITESEFNELRTNFNIPSLGKLTCTYDRMKRVKERYNNIKKLREC